MVMKYITIEYKFSEKPTGNRIEHPLLLLLESLKTQGSIGGAAKYLNRSYRHVWGELKYWESQLDANLVVWGKNGKPAVLTQEAIQYLNVVSKTNKDLEDSILNIKKLVTKNTQLIQRSRQAANSKANPNSLK
jgi:molybdate transport repressor ModE-like protein